MTNSNHRHLTFSSDSHYQGLPVNCDSSRESYLEILEKSYRELTLLLARYTRAVVIRMDLYLPDGADIDKGTMAKLTKQVRERLAYTYNSKVAYLWVMESKEDGTGVHWHLWVGVKFENTMNKEQPARIQKIIAECWEKNVGGGGYHHKSAWFYLQRKSTTYEARKEEQYLIANELSGVLISAKEIEDRVNKSGWVLGGVIDECFFALSYLAKSYTKVRTAQNKGMRMFSCSNVGTKDNRRGRRERIESNLEVIKAHLLKEVEPVKTASRIAVDEALEKLYQSNEPTDPGVLQYFAALKGGGNPPEK